MGTLKLLLALAAGVAAGAVAGVALGVLYAPEKGSTTRRKLVRSGCDVAGDIKDQFNEYVDAITDGLKSAKETVEDRMEAGRETILAQAQRLR